MTRPSTALPDPHASERYAIGDVVVASDEQVVGVVREIAGTHLVVERADGGELLFIPCAAIPTRAHAEGTIVLASTLAELMSQGWSDPPGLGVAGEPIAGNEFSAGPTSLL
jgi:hypothetical protein